MPSSPEESMTQEEKWIEDYKSLTFWNKHDNDAVISFDRIFIPVILGLPVYAMRHDSSSIVSLFGFTAGLFLLITWGLLSLRYRWAIDRRYELLRQREKQIGLKAHLAYYEINKQRSWPLRDRWVRLIFFCIVFPTYLGFILYLLRRLCASSP